MKYWDSSSIVPLLVDEVTSESKRRIHREDPSIVTWWGTVVECESALSRLERDVRSTGAIPPDARARLASLADSWTEIGADIRVRNRALRLLRTHPLRSADALQLAAALVAVSEHSAAIEFVCGDERLAEAARLEGFVTI